MTTRGLSAYTTTAFLKYRTDLVKLNNSLQSNLRSDDDKLTANYISAIERVGLEDKLRNDMLEFHVMHPGHVMTNANMIECIQGVLNTVEPMAILIRDSESGLPETPCKRNLE